MDKMIELFCNDELKHIAANRHRIAGIKHEDIPHYQGVIDGQIKAYDKILAEIDRLRQLP